MNGDVLTCKGCRSTESRKLDFRIAFQPIIDLDLGGVWGYEALVRGPNGEPAPAVLDLVDDDNRYWFDQACRVEAIKAAAALLPPRSQISINFMPNAVYEPRACIRATLEAAKRTGLTPDRLMFEFTESERVDDSEHLGRILHAYREIGFLTAIDDFGAGHAGLNLLARFQPDLVKIDMDLIRGIEGSPVKQAIIKALVGLSTEIGIHLLAEGVETKDEFEVLRRFGINMFQGYLFGRPRLDEVPSVAFDVFA